MNYLRHMKKKLIFKFYMRKMKYKIKITKSKYFNFKNHNFYNYKE
jgi:hypothetical protein